MTTTEAGSAAESLLFDALEGLKQGDVKPWVDMFHDDGVMEFPFAPPGYPARLDGKAAIADYVRTYPGGPLEPGVVFPVRDRHAALQIVDELRP